MTFEEALARITSLQTKGWRLGLDRMQEFLRRAGLDGALGLPLRPLPQPLSPAASQETFKGPAGAGEGGRRGPQYIHVAGTNGKGSVTAFLHSMLVAQGHRAGATFSPFVYDVRERIQIEGELISKEQFVSITERLWPIAQAMEGTQFEGPTEFEFKTAMGFAAWKEAGCEWVALETGLGGRLDATNVVTPACSAIVSIGYDHQPLLGNTLREIAMEKAGIIKPGCPVVVGMLDDEPLTAILEIAAERGSPVWVAGREVQFGPDWVEGPGFRYGGLRPGISGAVQPHNLAVAIAALHAAGAVRDPSRIGEGARLTRLPGRMERRWVEGQLWILDGAHNAESAQSVVDSLELMHLSSNGWMRNAGETAGLRVPSPGTGEGQGGGAGFQTGNTGGTPAVQAVGPLPQPLSSATSRVEIEERHGAGEGGRDADGMPAVRVMITGMLTGHDPIPFYGRFAERVEEVHVVPIDFHRTRDPFELAKEIEPLFPRVTAHATVQEAMTAVADAEAVLVTGSFYLVGEIGNRLGPWTKNT